MSCLATWDLYLVTLGLWIAVWDLLIATICMLESREVQGVPCQLQHKETTYFLHWKCYLESENCIKKFIDCSFLLFEPKFCLNISLALKEL